MNTERIKDRLYLIGTGLAVASLCYLMGSKVGEALLWGTAIFALLEGIMAHFVMHAQLMKIYENPAIAQTARQEIAALLEKGDSRNAMIVASRVFSLRAKDFPRLVQDSRSSQSGPSAGK